MIQWIFLLIVFSSLYPSVSRTDCHVTCVTVSSVVASFISAWQPWDIWALVTAGLNADRDCISVGVWRGWGLLTERIWWAGKDIHSAKALKSLFWVDANPFTFNSSFWQQRGQFWMRFWLGLLGPAGRERDLTFPASKRGAYVKTAKWLTPVKEKEKKGHYDSKKRNLRLIDKWVISCVWQRACCWSTRSAVNLIYSQTDAEQKTLQIWFSDILLRKTSLTFWPIGHITSYSKKTKNKKKNSSEAWSQIQKHRNTCSVWYIYKNNNHKKYTYMTGIFFFLFQSVICKRLHETEL